MICYAFYASALLFSEESFAVSTSFLKEGFSLQKDFSCVLLNNMYTTNPATAQIIVVIIATLLSLRNMKARPTMAMIGVIGYPGARNGDAVPFLRSAIDEITVITQEIEVAHTDSETNVSIMEPEQQIAS